MVELVNDYYLEIVIIPQISREGSHTIFTYEGNGKVNVIFSLFNLVSYKVIIAESAVVDNERSKSIEVEMYHLDGTFSKNTFAVIKTTDTDNGDIDFFSGNITELFPKMCKLYNKKMTELMNSLLITYYTMKKIISNLEKEKFMEETVDYFEKMVEYQKNEDIVGCLFLYNLSLFDYVYEEGFLCNMERMFTLSDNGTVKINSGKTLKQLIDNDFHEFLANLKRGYDKFLKIKQY